MHPTHYREISSYTYNPSIRVAGLGQKALYRTAKRRSTMNELPTSFRSSIVREQRRARKLEVMSSNGVEQRTGTQIHSNDNVSERSG